MAPAAAPVGAAGPAQTLLSPLLLLAYTIPYFVRVVDPSVAKEYVEVFGGRQTAILDNFRSLTLHTENQASTHKLANQAKGHNEEIEAFVNAVSNGRPMPIDYETLISVTQTTFLIHTSLDAGVPVDYVSPLSASCGRKTE